MTSPNDTVYPQLKDHISPHELERCYTPTAAELDYCAQHTRDDGQRLGFLVLLKTFQRLGYFIPTKDVPDAIISHIARDLGVETARGVLAGYDGSRNRHKHCRWIHDHLQVQLRDRDVPEVNYDLKLMTLTTIS